MEKNMQGVRLGFYSDYLNPPGNPTKFAPIPNPAPDLAVSPILGIYVSKILNVAAATMARRAISSMSNDCLGMAKQATATIKPSTKYLITRFIISLKLTSII